MLVLSRKLGEKFMIKLPGGAVVTVTVVDIEPGRRGKPPRKIRLGIEAPREVPVFRQELLEDKPLPLTGGKPE